MYKGILYVSMFLFSLFGELYAQEKTTLSAQIYGYQQEMVYFDCTQTPLIRQEFHTNPGEEHIYTFETDNLVCMLINGRTKLLLQPGDSLHVDIRYEGRNVQSIEFSGTPDAVLQNRIYQNVDMLKRDMRYKSQLLSCVALDIKPKARIEDSRLLLQQVTDMLNNAENKLPEAVKSYIVAEIESDVYVSFMEYPVMYASVRQQPIEQQEIGDYWKLMDGYQVRTDRASLQNPAYISLLMRYCFYQNEKKAKEQNRAYAIPSRFEDMYQELAAFYTDASRDAVLFTLICNFIRGGKEIERADVIVKDYKEKYNQAPQYMHILDSLLQ